MAASHGQPRETYSPWTVVNVVFGHLAEQGLHPTLGVANGNPGEPAAALLRALGIEPSADGDIRTTQRMRSELEQMRSDMLGDR